MFTCVLLARCYNDATMNMTFSQYLLHYLNWKQALPFLLIAALVITLAILILRAAAGPLSERPDKETGEMFSPDEKLLNLADRFFELIFSGLAIFLFVGIYFLIDYYGLGPAKSPLWSKYGSLLLLGMILLSVLLNSFLDQVIIPLSYIEPRERAAIRLIGMFYMIIIFVYIKFIYEDDNYDTIIMYFLGLIIGRFIYFDATLDGFVSAVSDAAASLPLMLLALGCTGAMAWYGFGVKYLLRSNGVVMSLMIAQLFMTVVIFFARKILLGRIRRRRFNDYREE